MIIENDDISSNKLSAESSTNKLKKMQDYYRDFAPFLTLGFQLAVAVVIFILIGHWVDTNWDISPFGKLVGMILGSVGGLVKFYKTVESYTKKKNSNYEN